MKNKYVIFDLDDTLAYEMDFLKSAYLAIALGLEDENVYEIMLDKYSGKENVFEFLSQKYNIDVQTFLEQYRTHFPEIKLIEGVQETLDFCKQENFKLGLISDGRSITQRNKLKALKIEELFDKIIISEEFGSEKPNENNFLAFMEDGIESYIYIADNPKKDFITPNKLGWTTICLLDDGANIHKQDFNVSDVYLPKIKSRNYIEMLEILKDIEN